MSDELREAEEIWIQSKIVSLRDSDALIDKIVRQHAELIAVKRRQMAYYEYCYRSLFSERSLEARNFINAGPGSFRHRYWRNLDKLYGDEGVTWGEMREKKYASSVDIFWDMLDRVAIDIDDNSIEIVYCSHLIEHAWNDDVDHFFKEVWRILKWGGLFRVVAPDIDFAVRSLQHDDWAFFLQYNFVARRKGKLSQLDQLRRTPIEFHVLKQGSLLTERRNSFNVNELGAVRFFHDRANPYDALTDASELSDRDLNKELGRHVNWFNESKVTYHLRKAGFKQILRNGFGQSLCPVLRDTSFFDHTDPWMSIYVDAMKS